MTNDARYIDQALLLDDLYDFHGDWFALLSTDEMQKLDLFFGTVSQPENVIVWRDKHCMQDPLLEQSALATLDKFLLHFGVSLDESGTSESNVT